MDTFKIRPAGFCVVQVMEKNCIFLEHNRGQAAHPFYWAGFVGIGNMRNIK